MVTWNLQAWEHSFAKIMIGVKKFEGKWLGTKPIATSGELVINGGLNVERVKAMLATQTMSC